MTVTVRALSATLALWVPASTSSAVAHAKTAPAAVFQEVFPVDKADLTSTGRNPYVILEPGDQLSLDGPDGKKKVKLVITVLDQTEKVDGVETRVVEERESADGNLVEVSRNFFAISKKTNDVYYFGEDVDIYKDGLVIHHEGSWRAGVAGARFGLFMPGKPVVGAKYYQELAPPVAMDRFEIKSIRETLQTPAGKFEACLKAEETTPLEPQSKDYKIYAPGVGLVQDGKLVLVKHVDPGSGL